MKPKTTTDRLPAWKLSISLPGDIREYVCRRATHFGGSLSGYMHYLIDQEMCADAAGASAEIAHRAGVAAAVKKRMPRATPIEGSGDLVAVAGSTGYFPVLRYDPKELLREVALAATAVNDHGLKKLVMVLPAKASDAEIKGLLQVRGAGLVPELEVIRLSDI